MLSHVAGNNDSLPTDITVKESKYQPSLETTARLLISLLFRAAFDAVRGIQRRTS